MGVAPFGLVIVVVDGHVAMLAGGMITVYARGVHGPDLIFGEGIGRAGADRQGQNGGGTEEESAWAHGFSCRAEGTPRIEGARAPNCRDSPVVPFERAVTAVCTVRGHPVFCDAAKT